MSLATVISIILLLLGLSDGLTTRMPRLQRDIFYVAFFLTWFLCIIKYYYGSDTVNYVRFYEHVPHYTYVLAHSAELTFETGFAVFCSVLHSWGVSYYWMTAIVSTVYFVALYFLLRMIPQGRTFALMIVFVLDANLPMVQLRQCMAVAFFILMVLSLQNKRYLLTALFAILACSFHRSGIFMVALTLFFSVLHSKTIPLYLYQLLIFVLAILIIIPLYKVIAPVVRLLPFPDEYADTIVLHFRKGRQVQMVFFIYMTAVVCLAHYVQYRKTLFSTVGIVTVIGLVFMVSFYQFFFLLNRIRSYFLPFVVVYIFRLLSDKDALQIPYAALLKQTAAVVIYVLMLHATYRSYTNNHQLISNPSNVCTVFELLHADKHAVQSRQMQLAENYWRYDYMKHDVQNQIK